MFSRIREHFGTAGLIVAVVALVAALGGGAYAATGSGGKATASKAKQGPRGKTGKTGPAGPAGPQGSAGAKGDSGAAGSNGSNGSNGTSASTETFNGAAHGCTAGGVIVKSASPEAIVCNGQNGTNGQTGFTETLPEGKTETGIWGASSGLSEGKQTLPISFPIPLVEAPEVVIVKPEEFSNEAAGCPGRGGGTPPPTGIFEPTTPEADPGKLCIYVDRLAEATLAPLTPKIPVYDADSELWNPKPGPVASQVGTLLEVRCEVGCEVAGTWAVTGPEE